MLYFVYILQCSDKTLYVGSTNDLEKRLHAHNNLKSGAHYTKIRRPVVLKYSKRFKTYSEARKKLLALIKKYLKKNGRYSNIILAGYNVRFDLRFINEYLISEDDWEELVHYKVHDVMDGVDFLKRNGWLPSDIGKLTKCAEYFEVAQGIAHTAKDDIFMTIAVDGKIKELMDSKKNGGQQVDLISQLEAE